MTVANKARPRLFQSYLPAAVSLDRLPFGSVLAPRFAFRLKPDIAGLIRTAQTERNAMIPLKTVSRPQPSIRHAGLPRRWVAIAAKKPRRSARVMLNGKAGEHGNEKKEHQVVEPP
jgi:hypothetical protein